MDTFSMKGEDGPAVSGSISVLSYPGPWEAYFASMYKFSSFNYCDAVVLVLTLNQSLWS